MLQSIYAQPAYPTEHSIYRQENKKRPLRSTAERNKSCGENVVVGGKVCIRVAVRKLRKRIPTNVLDSRNGNIYIGRDMI